MSRNAPSEPTAAQLERRLRAALLEDLGPTGDVTSRALVPADARAEAYLLVKADGILCGLKLIPPILKLAEELLARKTKQRACPTRVRLLKSDGARVHKGDVVARLHGSARVVLAAERTLLNLVCHLSGIATQTARYVEAVRGTQARILDTRKTTPLWRDLEKYAVVCGGGVNHRIGLYDMILIKDNHLALWGAKNPAEAVCAARAAFPDLPVEVEVCDLAGLKQVCRFSEPEFVLLDNFSPEQTREAVAWVRGYYSVAPGRPRLESSGGITLDNVRAFALAGADRISIGALTHSVRALDLSLEVLPRRAKRAGRPSAQA